MIAFVQGHARRFPAQLHSAECTDLRDGLGLPTALPLLSTS